MPPSVRPHIFIATHHKSGTVWMLSTFRRIAKANNFAFIHLNTGEFGWEIRPDKLEYFEEQRVIAESQSDLPAIFVDFHSAIPDLTSCKATRGARGIHVIRDPRDMLLSAVRYHLVSDESWLHKPDPQWGGRTYAECLRSFDSLEDQIRWEMDHYMGKTIRTMANFPSQGVFKTVRYEDLISDTEMIRFKEVLEYLELDEEENRYGLDAFWKTSIFGDRFEHDRHTTKDHIFNSRPRQWTQLSTRTIDLIEQRFGKEIAQLGYESSHNQAQPSGQITH